MSSSLRRLVLGARCFFSSALLLVFFITASALHAASPAALPTNSITVMTQNLYLGASADLLINAPSPDQIPERVAEV